MKKLFNVLVLMLAINFLAIAGGVGYLRATGHLDREKVMAVKDVLFPKPVEEIAAPTTQPVDPTTRPALRLEELLAQQTGRSVGEQVEFIQQTFDSQMTQLDRRQRELNDLQRQIDLAKQQLSRDRGSLDQQKQAVATREQEQTRLANDKNFQDSLALYRAMPAKQVKGVFMAMEPVAVSQFLQAMEPRAATRIIKEFKAPDESKFLQQVLGHMRPNMNEGPTTAPLTSAKG